jgi:hypothetical protein
MAVRAEELEILNAMVRMNSVHVVQLERNGAAHPFTHLTTCALRLEHPFPQKPPREGPRILIVTFDNENVFEGTPGGEIRSGLSEEVGFPEEVGRIEPEALDVMVESLVIVSARSQSEPTECIRNCFRCFDRAAKLLVSPLSGIDRHRNPPRRA